MSMNDQEIPEGLSRLDPKSKQEISYEKRETLLRFNTKQFWWCYYDKDTYKLYDQFCALILDDARDYLKAKGCLDNDLNFLKELSYE